MNNTSNDEPPALAASVNEYTPPRTKGGAPGFDEQTVLTRLVNEYIPPYDLGLWGCPLSVMSVNYQRDRYLMFDYLCGLLRSRRCTVRTDIHLCILACPTLYPLLVKWGRVLHSASSATDRSLLSSLFGIHNNNDDAYMNTVELSPTSLTLTGLTVSEDSEVIVVRVDDDEAVDDYLAECDEYLARRATGRDFAPWRRRMGYPPGQLQIQPLLDNNHCLHLEVGNLTWRTWNGMRVHVSFNVDSARATASGIVVRGLSHVHINMFNITQTKRIWQEPRQTVGTTEFAEAPTTFACPHADEQDHYEFYCDDCLQHHTPTSECTDQECIMCGARDCPHGEPLHYHHDGCPSC